MKSHYHCVFSLLCAWTCDACACAFEVEKGKSSLSSDKQSDAASLMLMSEPAHSSLHFHFSVLLQLMQQIRALRQQNRQLQTPRYTTGICPSLYWRPLGNLTPSTFRRRSTGFPWHRRGSHLWRKSPKTLIRLNRGRRRPQVIRLLITIIRSQ